MAESSEERTFRIFFSTGFTSPCITLTLSKDLHSSRQNSTTNHALYLRGPRDVSVPIRMKLEGSPDDLVNGSNVPIRWGDQVRAGEQCEDLLWLKFLRSLGSTEAAEIIDALYRKEGPEYYHDALTPKRVENLDLYDQVFFVAFLKAVNGHYTAEFAKEDPARTITTKLRIPLPLWVTSEIQRNLESFFQLDETFAQYVELASMDHDNLSPAAIGLRSEDICVGDGFIVCHMEEQITSVTEYRVINSAGRLLEFAPQSSSKITLVGYSDFGRPFMQYLRAKLSRWEQNSKLDPALVYSQLKTMQGALLLEFLPSAEVAEYYEFISPWIPNDCEDVDDKIRIKSWVIYNFFLRSTLNNIASEIIKLIANEKNQSRVVLSGFFTYCHRVSVYLKKLLVDSLDEFSEKLKFVTREPKWDETPLPPYQVFTRPSEYEPTPIIEFEKPSAEQLGIRLRSLKNVFTKISDSNADALISIVREYQRIKWDLELLLIESLKRHGTSAPTRDISIFAITLYTHMKVPSEVKRIGTQFTEGYERAMKLSWTSSLKYRNAHKLRGIHFASSHGDLDCLEILVAAGVSVVQPVYDDSSEVFTPLILAVDAGQAPAVVFLLKNGAHPKAQISDGRTALHFCSEQSDFKLASEMVALLVNASPNRAFIETKDKKKKTAKDIAKKNRLGSLESFISRETRRVLLLDSITTGKHNPVERLASIDRPLFFDVQEGLTAMHLAAKSNRGTILELLNKIGFQISPRTRLGRTPLHLAAEEGHIEMIRLLERLGADRSELDESKNNALHLAARNGKDQMVSLLLGYGVNPLLQNNRGETALHLAVCAGHQSIVSILLKFLSPSKGKGKQRENLMELALPQEEVLEEGVMLESQQTISSASHAYNHMAMEMSPSMHTAASQLKLHSQPSSMGGSLLHQSRTPAMGKTFNQTVQKGLQAQSVPEIQPRGSHGLSISRDVVSTESSNGQRQDLIESNDAGGQTALHLAVALDHLEIIKILLENGAKVSSRNSMRRNPFHIAAGNGSLGVLEILLRDIHRPEHHLIKSSTALEGNEGSTFSHLIAFDKSGWTPLHFAAGNGHDRVVNRLLQVCPTLIKHTHSQSCHGWTPLQLACKSGYLSIADHLLQASADLSTHPKGGNARTPLQAAAEGGHLEVVELLLKAGADVNASPDKLNGKTPLQAAASGGHLEVVCMLLASGADVSAPAAEVGGRTALQAAEDSGDIETLEKVLAAIWQDADSSITSTPEHAQEPSSNSHDTSRTSNLASIVKAESTGDISKGTAKDVITAAANEVITSLVEKGTEIHQQPVDQGSTGDDRLALIIGIEFGAEFSKVSFCYPEFDPEPWIAVNLWPGPGFDIYSEPQVPSIIEYDDEAQESFKWGYEADPDSPNCIKQLPQILDPHGCVPRYAHLSILKNRRIMARLRKSSIGVACDYLGTLYDHACKELLGRYPKEFLQTLRVQVILTVPDIISDQGKTNFYSAAKFKGVDSVTLISKTDATATYVNHFTEEGEVYTICDVGNQNSDIYSYQKTKPGDPIAQLVPSCENYVASNLLDSSFAEHVQKVIGEESFFSFRRTKAYSYALKQFQCLVKPSFTGEKREEWHVDFPMAGLTDDEANGLEDDFLRLNCETIRAMFEPFTRELVALIKEQISKVQLKMWEEGNLMRHPIKKIFLLGECVYLPYVKLQIQDHFPDIQAIQLPNASNAIVLGAAMSQIPPEVKITSTVAVRHYGVIVEDGYDVTEDAGQQTRCRRQRESSVVRKTVLKMHWFIGKGQELGAEKIQIQCQETIENHNRTLLQHASFDYIAVMNRSTGPKLRRYLIESSEVKAPTYFTSELARINCYVEIDLTNWSKRHLLENLRVGHYLTIDYTIIIDCKAANMEFSCKIDDEWMKVTPHYESTSNTE